MNNTTYWLQKEFITEIVNEIPAAIFWKDVNGVFLGCNLIFAKLAGLESPQDIIGKTDFDLPWGEKQAALYRKDDVEIMDSKKPKLNIEENIYLSDGSKLYLLTNKKPLLTIDGKVMGILGIFHDITERKISEVALKKAKYQAESADRAKAEFIANMSHDIRTLLTGIIGLSSIVEDESHEEKIKEYAHMLNLSGSQLLSLLNSVLDIVASDSIGAKSLRISTFNFEELLNSIFELEVPSLELNSIQFNLELASALPSYIQSDKEKIYRIILNILSNAIKFTHDGHITVKGSLLEENGDEILMLLQVIDTGIGISKEDIGKVFDKFYRANPAHKGQFDGHGVGLHIVQQYLKLLKGKIEIESQEGKGSCISLTLPLKKGASPKNIIKKQVVNDELKKPDLKTKAHVLLVEDNLMARKVVSNMLSKLNCSFLEAENSTDAFDLFAENSFDFVLTDIGLPDYSGFELAKKIRAFEIQDNKKPTPIIALSGHIKKNVSDYQTEYGLTDIFEKPIKTDELSHLVHQYSKQKKSLMLMMIKKKTNQSCNTMKSTLILI